MVPWQVRAAASLPHMRVLDKLSLFCKPGYRDTVGQEGVTEVGRSGEW